MRKQLPAVSVNPSLSFFLGLQCRWPPPVCPPTLGAPSIVFDFKMLIGRPVDGRPVTKPSWGVLKFEGLASGSDRRVVAVTIELVNLFLFVVHLVEGREE